MLFFFSIIDHTFVSSTIKLNIFSSKTGSFLELSRVGNLVIHMDLDLNGKRPGIASDGNFSSYLIGRT